VHRQHAFGWLTWPWVSARELSLGCCVVLGRRQNRLESEERVSSVRITAIVLGVVLLLGWILYIPVGRHWFRRRGGLMYATVFQWHILPFIIGVGLVVSGNLLVLLVLPVAWVLSIFFPKFFMFIFPLVSGWVHGGLLYSHFYGGSGLWYYISCVGGLACMFLVCTVITAIVTGR
jgi:hypothetical protein